MNDGPAEAGQWHAQRSHGGPRTLVFLHGSALSGRLWDPLVRLLPDDVGACIQVDLPGCGDSPAWGRQADQDYAQSAGLDMYAAGLARFLDAAGTPTIHLVGHGFGAAVALDFAARHADRATSLALVSPPAAMGVEPGVPTLWDTPANGQEAVARFIQERIARRPLPSDTLRALASDVLRASPAVREASRHTLEALPFDDASLASIACPALVIAGDRDPEAPVHELARMAERLSDGGLAVVHNAGHLLPVEAAAIVREVLVDFLAEAAGR